MKRLTPSAIAATSKVNQPLRINAMAFAVGLALSSPAALLAQNLPTGLQTTNGSVTVTNPTATSMGLIQSTPNAGMSAQTFGIGSGYRVDVLQPSSSSVMVMNVLGGTKSSIFGTLTANGHLFLINPAGVMFAPGSSVDVGGIVATTLPISYADATSGRYVFTNNGSSGEVVNQGRITALNGYVGLFAPKVINEGIIVARMGQVVLAAGNQVTLDMVGDGLIKVAVTESALNAAVMNKGTIEADGGNVLLTAKSANALLDTVINTDGIIRANTIANRNGTIVLDGGDKGVVSVSGTIEAKGIDAGTTGGTIKALGQYVGVGLGGTTTTINAAGDAGGGTILIGGNFHGAGPEQNASMTYIGAGATINADAGSAGNGGQVAVWSDNATQFYGNITALGGAQSGNGGFVETSGRILDATGTVGVSARNGSGGTWLLDPFDLTISNDTNNDVTAFAATASGARVNAGSIQSALNGGSDVTVTTGTFGSGGEPGDITVKGTADAFGAVDINMNTSSTGATQTLTLQAAGSIFMDSGSTIRATGTGDKLNVTLNSRNDDGNATPNGAVVLTGATINTQGGDIVIGGGTSPSSTPAVGTATNKAGVSLLSGSVLDAGTGDLTITGRGFAGSASANYGVLISGASEVKAEGTISITGTGGANGDQNYGVYITGTNSKVTSIDGSIGVTGTGAGTNDNTGVFVASGGKIESTGAATVTVHGTGSGTGDGNRGVRVQGADSKITSLDGNLSVTGTGGNVSDDANAGVYVLSGGEISSTGAATVTVQGTGRGTGGGNHGVYVEGNNARITSASGNLSVTGTAADEFGISIGVLVLGGGEISSTGAATVTVQGSGGSLPLTQNSGVAVMGAGSKITSVDGNLSVTGIGGSGTSSNFGVWVWGGEISSTGAATVSVQGNGGSFAGFGVNGTGVYLEGIGGIGGKITSANGNLSVTGTGGSGTDGNFGVLMANWGEISSTGAATITVQGTGAGTGTGNDGVVLASSSKITSVDGNISVTGTGAAGTSHGVRVESSGTLIESTGSANIFVTGTAGGSGAFGITTLSGLNRIGGGLNTGNITLVADSMSLADVTIRTTGAGIVTLKPKTAGTAIDLGGADGVGTLGLTNAELNTVSAPTLQIGDASSGDMTISAAIAPAGATILDLQTGGSIAQGAGATITATTLTGTAGTSVGLNESNAITNLGAFTVGTTFTLNDVGGLNVTGNVAAGGTTSITSTGLLSLGADIDATGQSLTLGGVGVTQSAGKILAAGTTINGGAGAITLASTTNDFTGTVDANNSGASAIQITDANDITVGTIASPGNAVSVTSVGGSILDDGAASAITGGSVTLIASAGSVGSASGAPEIDVATANLTVTANNNMHVASSVPFTDLALTLNPGSTGNTYSLADGSGTYTLSNPGSDLLITALQKSGTNFSMTATTGSILLADNAITAGAGNIGLTATTGSILDNTITVADGAAEANISSTGTVTLQAPAGSIGAPGDGDIDIAGTTSVVLLAGNGAYIGSDVSPANLTLILDPAGSVVDYQFNGGGTIVVIGESGGNVNVTTVSSTVNDFDLNLTASSGNINVGAINLSGTGSDVLLTSLLGGITLGSGAITTLDGNVTLTAATGITGPVGANSITITTPLTGFLSLNSGTGGVNGAIGDGSGGPLMSAMAGDLLINSGANGNVNVKNTGALTLTSFSKTGSGNLNIATASPLTIAADVIMVGDVVLDAPEAGVAAAGDDLTVNTGITVQSTAGSVTLNAGDDVVLSGSAIVDGFTGVFLNAAVANNDAFGGITQAAAGTILGPSLTTTSRTGTTLAGTANAVGSFSATNSTSGNVSLTNTGGMDIAGITNTVGDVTLTDTGAVTQSGAIAAMGLELLGSGSYSLTDSGNAVTTIAANTGGAISYRDTDSLTVGTVGGTTGITTSNDNLTLQAGTSLAINEAINIGVGDLSLTATTGITQTATGLITAGGTTTLAAGTGVITLTEANDFGGTVNASNSGGNAIQITDANNIILGTVTAAGGGDVTATSTAGSILNDASSATRVTGNLVTLSASSGANSIGTSGNPLDTAATTLVASAGTGGVFINELDGITLNAQTNPGDFSLTAGGTITVAGAQSFAGNYTLDAQGASSDLLVQNNLTSTGTGGQTLTLQAANSILFSASADVGTTNPLNVVLNSDRDASGAGAISLGSGTTISSMGGDITLGGGASPLATAAFGTAANKDGISLDGATLTSGTGAITMTGQGFAGSIHNNNGIVFQNASVATASSGAITLTGTGGAGGGVSNFGVQIKNDSKVESTGSGAISITGTGVNPTDSQGILLAFGTNTIGGGSATGDILLRSLSGSGIQLGFIGGGDVAAEVTTTGNVTLNAQGGGGVNQISGAITAAGLRLLGSGAFTLNGATNEITTLAGAMASGSTLDYRDATGISIGSITSNDGTGSTTSDGLNVGTGTVSLTTTASGSAITQTALGVITAGTLNLTTIDANATLDTATNAVTNLGTVALGTGALNLLDAGGLTVTGAVSATGGVTLETNGALAINNTVDAGAGNVTLNSSGAVTQGVSGDITAAGLELQGAGSYTLTNLTNDVTTIAGSTTGTVKYVDANALAVGTVTSTGLQSAANVKLNSQTSDLTVTDPIDVGAGTVTLQALAGNVTQGAGGTITAGTLGVRAGTAIDLSAATNAVSTTVAMNAAGGDLKFTNGSGYDIGSVAADAPVFSTTTNGLSAAGNNITLDTAGAVTQSQAIAASGLELLGAGSYTLTDAGNNVTTIAANTTNTVSYRDADTVTVGTVGGTTGITSGGNDVTLQAGGDIVLNANVDAGTAGVALSAPAGSITQNAGTITAAALGISATAASTLTATSPLTTIAASITGAGNPFKFTQNGPFDVGTVGPIVGVTTNNADITLQASAGDLTLSQAVNAGTATVRLQSDAGSVTQTGTGTITAATLGVNAGTSINLSLAPNAISTTVAMSAGGGTLGLNNASGYNINTVAADGALFAQADGLSATTNITLNTAAGTVTQSATKNVTASGLELLGASIYTLNGATNVVTTLAGDTGTVNFLDTGGLAIGTVNTAGLTTAGGLTINTSGPLTQSAPLVVGGTSSFDVGGNAITLTNGSNNFGGAVTLTGGTTQIVDMNALTLDTLSTGALTVTSTGALNLGQGTVGGALIAASNGGAITQSGALSIAGTSNITSGAALINLGDAGNDFGGGVTASSTAGGVTFVDINTFTPTSINSGTGIMTLTADSIGPGSITSTAGTGTVLTLNSQVAVTDLNVIFPNVTGGSSHIQINGDTGTWVMTGSANLNFFNVYNSPLATPTSFTPPDLRGTMNGVSVLFVDAAAVVAADAAAAAASAEAAASASDLFGTDSVAQIIEFGFVGDIGTLPPIDHRLQGVGISVPKCFNESREGEDC